MRPKKTLTGKQNKMIVERTKDTTAPHYEIIRRAGYNVNTTTTKGKQTATQIYGENMRKPEIQIRIDQALEAQGATPEFAIGVIKEVAEQKKEVGARRLAANDLLELNGYKKSAISNLNLNVNKGFFRVAK